jgi:hypothetical protein
MEGFPKGAKSPILWTPLAASFKEEQSENCSSGNAKLLAWVA